MRRNHNYDAASLTFSHSPLRSRETVPLTATVAYFTLVWTDVFFLSLRGPFEAEVLSGGRGIIVGFGAGRAGIIGLGPGGAGGTARVHGLRRTILHGTDIVTFLAMGLELGLAVGIDFALGKDVGAGAS